MERAAKDQFEYSIATLPPTRRQRQLAFLVVIVTLAAFGAMIPFADMPMQRFDSFIPTMIAIVFVTDLVTAVLLFGQFSATGITRTPGACQRLSFFQPDCHSIRAHLSGRICADRPAWGRTSEHRLDKCYLAIQPCPCISGLCHSSFLASSRKMRARRRRNAIIRSVMIVIVAVGTLTWVATAGGGLLPGLLLDGRVLPLGHTVNGMVALTNILTLLLLWTRGRSVLDLWLMVAVCAQIEESLLVAFFLTARFTFGFYAIRVIWLVVSKVVLIVLLSETVILHARLSVANRNLRRERENKLTSAAAVVAALAHEVRQPLSGITSRAAAGRRFLDRVPPDIATAKRLFEQHK